MCAVIVYSLENRTPMLGETDDDSIQRQSIAVVQTSVRRDAMVSFASLADSNPALA